MFIFLRLLLAHCIADFPLQFDKIFELKHKGLLGGIPHALIMGSCFIIFLWPYLHIPGIWVFVYFFTLLHLFQDTTKIKLGNIKYTFLFYLLDQLFHILAISMLLLTKLRGLTPPAANGNILIELYNSDTVMIWLIAVILGSYNGLFLIRSFKISFLKKENNYLYSSFEKWFGMLERTLIVVILGLGGYLYLLLPGILMLRHIIFYAAQDKINVKKPFISPSELALSWVIAVTTGIALRMVLRGFY